MNIREQCSWTHTDDREGATEKAIKLVRAGIARTRLTEPLEPLEVETTPAALVIGGGVTGMRAALGLAQLGLGVFLVEREPALGGHVVGLGELYPHGADGRELVERLREEIVRHPEIAVFTNAEVTAKSGTFGNYRALIRAGGESIHAEVGQVIVATGFESYEPADGEYGYGLEGVVTLPQLRQLLDAGDGPLLHEGRPVRSIAYVYCVGSRCAEHPYCSRFCCSAAVHASLLAARRDPGLRQYHLYRDLRTYGRNELMLGESRERGSVYIRFADDDPPLVAGENGSLRVTVRDQLTAGEELELPVDLVVLVTGMVARRNEKLVDTLKLPVGVDGFFNEIHPKLRPVETVVDGVTIAGACQGPKTVAESVAAGLAAVAQAGAVLKRGIAQLDPQVALVHPDACTGCGDCLPACAFGALSLVARDGGEVALVDPAGCKGCGACAPVCPEGAIDLQGYTDAQVRAAIDALLVGTA